MPFGSCVSCEGMYMKGFRKTFWKKVIFRGFMTKKSEMLTKRGFQKIPILQYFLINSYEGKFNGILV